MSVVEDVRQVVQDFLAPELRALKTELEAQRKLTESSFRVVDVKLDAIEQQIRHLVDAMALDKRLSKLEAQQPAATQ